MRVFVAIDLPADLKKELFAFAKEITRKLKVKLVEEENLHLTLVFLGEIDSQQVEEVKGILSRIKVGEIELSLGKVKVFPTKLKPQLIWIEVGGQTGKLFSLYKQIVDTLLNKGFFLKKDNFNFLPHITVARVKGGGVGSMEGVGLEGKFKAQEVTLFESKLGAQGPVYLKIGEFEVK